MAMKLYDLTESYARLLDMADEMEDDVYRDTLESIKEPLEEKAENTAKVIKSLEAEAKAIRDEEKRLADRRRTLENKGQRLKDYLQSNLEAAGIKKVKGKLLNVSIQKNAPSLYIEKEDYIPSNFYEEQAPKLNRKALLDHLKNGGEVDGVSVRIGESIRIR